MSQATLSPSDIQPHAPIGLRGENEHDRVTSLLMALIVGACAIVLWLFVVYLANQAYAKRVAAPISIVEVFGGGGGSPDGEVGSTEKVEVANAPEGAAASNSDLEASSFEEPSVERSLSTAVDDLGEVVEADLAEAMESGGPVASGQRMSKRGTGGPGYGLGPGDGGVAREQRWSILYNQGQTIEEYARQLDALGVEMATIIGDQLHYASRFSDAQPRRRIGTGRGDDRLYFLWQGGGRRDSDLALLKKAGIEVGPRGAIFQFYPKGAEDVLARLEVQYRGLQPSEIRTTRFMVVPAGSGYDFRVIDQKPLN